MTDLQTELPATAVAPALARQALDGWLSASVGEETAQDVRIMATELVANAVRHGGLSEADKIILSGTVDDVVRIEVEQPSPVTEAKVMRVADPVSAGIGLLIVDTVANRWGSAEGPPGVVWFEVVR